MLRHRHHPKPPLQKPMPSLPPTTGSTNTGNSNTESMVTSFCHRNNSQTQHSAYGPKQSVKSGNETNNEMQDFVQRFEKELAEQNKYLDQKATEKHVKVQQELTRSRKAENQYQKH